MEAINDTQNVLVMDGSESIGGANAGMRPMQLLLTAVGGCSSIDVISILKKQKQEPTKFSIEVEGDSEKEEQHSVWKRIRLNFELEGDLDPSKVLRAAELSMTKYCSVSKALEPKSEITYSVKLNGEIIR